MLNLQSPAPTRTSGRTDPRGEPHAHLIYLFPLLTNALSRSLRSPSPSLSSAFTLPSRSGSMELERVRHNEGRSSSFPSPMEGRRPELEPDLTREAASPMALCFSSPFFLSPDPTPGGTASSVVAGSEVRRRWDAPAGAAGEARRAV